MSMWTHVAGVIRIDSIEGDHRKYIKRVKEIMGTPCGYDGSQEDWENCTIPRGSEGSIQFKVSASQRNGVSARGRVVFWGDLRDFGCKSHNRYGDHYGSIDGIKKWLKEIVKKANNDKTFLLAGVRNVVVEIKCEGCDSPVIFTEKDLT